MVTHFEVRHWLDGRHLLKGHVYFNLGTQKGGAYLKPGAYLRKYGILEWLQVLAISALYSKTVKKN